MKPTIIARNKDHLIQLIELEIKTNGNQCDLNHIDVSSITNMEALLDKSPKFNGDISNWDVSNVTDMSYMFFNSCFNSDISNWDVSNVKNMCCLFNGCAFSRDISKWNVSKVENMQRMFYASDFNCNINNWDVSNVKDMHEIFSYSKFNGDITNWKPYELECRENIFINSSITSPYWIAGNNKKERIEIIEKYWSIRELAEEIQQELYSKNIQEKRMKI